MMRTLGIMAAFLTVLHSSVLARRAVNSCPELTASAANISVIAPVLDYTVTRFDANWFNTKEPEKAPVLFTIFLSPTLQPYAGKLTLRIRIEVDTSLGRNNEGRLVAFDNLTQPLEASQIGVPLPSNQIFALNYQPGGTNFENSDFFKLVHENADLPEMNLTFKFALACENGGLLGETKTTLVVNSSGPVGRFRQVRSVRAISPGNDVASSRPSPLYTINPVFYVSSELLNRAAFKYPETEPALEIFLYRIEDGQNAQEAMDGMEYARFTVSDAPVAYPPHLPPLEPGKKYAWRVRALLRGSDPEYRFSNALTFMVDSRLDGKMGSEIPTLLSDPKAFADQVRFGDDYVKRVLAALKVILGENYEVFELSRLDKIPAQGQLRINGQPITLDELERLAREFHQSRHSVVRLRFQ